MLNCNPNKIKSAIYFVFKKIAYRPYSAFFALFFIFSVIALYIFFQFRTKDFFDETQKIETKKELFNSAQVKKYGQVFGIIAQRRQDYGQAASSTYPEVFAPQIEDNY